MTVMARSLPVAAPAVAAGRDSALDFTKGLLVLFMVLYHWANYFMGRNFGPDGKYYDYLRFLTPGFIFITGFMISHVLLKKYGGTHSHLARRLVVRGLKLLALFVGLNILAGLALPGSLIRRALAGASVLRSLAFIFVSGDLSADGGPKSAAFNILIPFAYLLILSGGLILISRRIRYAFHFACALTVLALIPVRIQDIRSPNLEMVLAGLLGVVFGYAQKKHLTALLTHPYVVGGLYCAYLAAISLWGMSIPLEITSVILTTTLFYILGTRAGSPGIVCMLGKYSLLAYISQIAILQVLRRIAWLSQHGVAVLISPLIMGAVLMVLIVGLVDWAIGKSKAVSHAYQVVFG